MAQVPQSKTGTRRRRPAQPTSLESPIVGSKNPHTKGIHEPKPSEHAVTLCKIRDVQGNEVAVGEKTILSIRYPIDDRRKVRYEVTFKPTPQLWGGLQHHSLTHAIRVMRCFTSDKNLREDMARLELRQSPHELLKKLGLPGEEVAVIIRLLKERGALEFRVIKRENIWDVNMAAYGFGPENRRHGKAEMGSRFGRMWILPEFMTADEIKEEAVDTVMHVPDGSGEFADGFTDYQRRVAVDRSNQLNLAYDSLTAMLSPDAQPDDQGWVEFTQAGSYMEMLSASLQLKTSADAYNLASELRKLGRYQGLQKGRGHSGFRIKLDLGPVTRNDVLGIRKPRPNTPATEPQQAHQAEPEQVPAKPETEIATPQPTLDVVEAISALLDQVDSLKLENAELKGQVASMNERNAALEAELLAAKQEPRGAVIPDELVQRLNRLSKPG